MESSRGRGRSGAPIAAALALLALALASGADAAAAAAPAVLTGGALQVSYGSATLTGSVNPRGSNTSCYFQYGPTRAYGAQSTIANAGAGTRSASVSVPVSGLAPLTVYHYRLVAVSGKGVASGKDRTLLTTRVPLSLQVLVSPNPVAYGGTVIVRGTLSGTGSGDSEVVLQANPFPYAAGFADVGNPELTLADGSFSFALPGLTRATQLRVVTTTKPAALGPVMLVNVAAGIDVHVGRTRRRHVVRFYGTVTPAEDGMKVGIMRAGHGRSVPVAGAILRHGTATSSRFSLLVRVKPGVYRVLVRITNGAQVSSYSRPLLIR